MAFTDNTTGGRVIEQAVGPVKITLAEAVKVGDLVTYNAGWVQADASTYLEAAGELLVAGETAASGATITAYHKARISGITTGTAGNLVYLSDVQGTYLATVGTVPRTVGVELGGNEIFVDPKPAGVSVTALANTATVTAAQLLTKVIDGTPTAAATYTLPTATLLLAGMPSYGVGSSFLFIINNVTAATYAITVAAGEGGTADGTLTVAAATCRVFMVIINSATTYLVYGIGA